MKSFPAVFLSAFLLTAIAVSAPGLSDAEKHFREGKIHQAHEEVEAILSRSPNYFPAQTLLFRITLDKKLYSKAGEILKALLKNRETEETRLLASDFYLATGDLARSREYILKVLDKDRRSMDALLNLALIEEKNGYTSRATSLFKEAGLVQESHPRYLYEYGKYLVRQKRLSELDQHLEKFRKSFPESDAYYHVLSQSASSAGKYDEALKAIQKALYYQPEKTAYLEQLRSVYEKAGRNRELIAFLKKDPSTSRDYIANYLLAHAYYIQNRKASWVLPDTNFNAYNIFPFLDKALSLNENQELVRFFAEELAVKNYPLAHPLREKYARFHRERAAFFSDAGDFDKMQLAYLRLLKLVPQNISDRDNYARYLKDQGFDASYLEELRLIRNFSPSENFKVNARIQLLERKLRGSVGEKYGLDPLEVDWVKNRVLLFPTFAMENKVLPNTEEILNRILGDRLNQVHQVQLVTTGEPNIERALAKAPSDFYITLNASEWEDKIKGEFTLWSGPKRMVLDRRTIVADGKEKVLDFVLRFGQWLQAALPKRGSILKVDPSVVVISLGKRDGITAEHRFDIFKASDEDQKSLGVLKPLVIDEYFSTAEIDDAGKLRFVKSGDVLQSRKVDPKGK
ncbi:MAG: hypothetical protein JNM63_08280 [Spirochaetia bacterium]|nr:hypothetical protein [Spirochaetia bacterium]